MWDVVLFNKDRNKDDREEAVFVELIPDQETEKELSEIEKRYKGSIKDLNSLSSEFKRASSSVKSRIKELQNGAGRNAVNNEVAMYDVYTKLMSGRLNCIQEKNKITKDIITAHHNEKKLNIDPNGGGIGSAGKELAASFFNGNSNGYNNQTSDILIDPLGVHKMDSSNTKDNTVQQNKNSTKIETEDKHKDTSGGSGGDFGSDETGMVDYEYSMNNLKNKDREIESILKYVPDSETYWVEHKDKKTGEMIDNIRKPHIGMLDIQSLDLSKNKAEDTYGNSYTVEVSSIDDMPEDYYKQWKENSKKLDNNTNI